MDTSTSIRSEAESVLDWLGAAGEEVPGPTQPPAELTPERWSSAWKPLLALLRPEGDDTPEPVAALRLVALAEAGGLPRPAAKEWAGRAMERSGRQSFWASWSGVRDREELRLRLEVLRFGTKIDAGLTGFLMFFFRASDPALYQAAALTVGTHYHACPELRTAVDHYIRGRSLDPAKPIALNGQRSRRRILLARTAAACAHPDTTVAPPFALAAWRERRHDLSDASALLLAAETCLRSTRPPDPLAADCTVILEAIARETNQPLDRALLQKWGRLLCLLVDHPHGPDTAASLGLWTRLLGNLVERLRSTAPTTFGETLRLLNLLDEVLRTVAFLPAAVQQRIEAAASWGLPPDLAALARLRIAVWQNRESDNVSTFSLHNLHEVLPAGADPDLFARLLSRPAPAGRLLLEDARQEAEADLAALLLRPLGDSAAWCSRAPGNRALTAFLLLDLAQFARLSDSRWAALLAHHGFRAASVPAEEAGPAPGRSRLSVATLPVLLRIISLEEDTGGSFVESRLLHQLQDDSLLVALLPSGRHSELLSILADAFEHHLRMRLAARPGFSPFRCLYRSLVRHPHEEFFSRLRAVCHERDYRRADGETIPLAAIIDHLATETRPETPDPAPALYPVFGDNFAAWLHGLRRAAPLALPADSPGDLLPRLAAWLGTDPDDEPGGHPTLLGLVRRLNEHAPPARRGYPAFDPRASDTLAADLARLTAGLLRSAPRIEAENLDELESVREAHLRLASDLEEIRTAWSPLLPVPEARLLAACLNQLRQKLDAAEATLHQLADVWNARADGQPHRPLATSL